MKILLDLFNFIVGMAMAFFTIVIFHPINRFKKLKTKEDQLFLQKTLLTTIFFLSVLLIYILIIFNISKKIFMIPFLFFNFYIIAIVLYNFFLAIELYSTFSNPVHYFNRLFKQQQYNYMPELIIFISCFLILIIDYFSYKNDLININNDVINSVESSLSSIFTLLGKWKNFIIIILSILSLILLYKIKSKIQTFCFKYKEKLYNIIGKRIMSNFLYLVYGLFYTFPIVTGIKINELYHIFGSIFFSIIIINDYSIHLSIIATTKFCEYRIKRTLLKYFCSFYYMPPRHDRASAPLVNETSYEATGMTTFQNETSTALDVITNNPKDKELVAIYKNGIFFEDYFFNYFDQILNIITASIFQVYNSNYFSSQANEKRLSSSINIGADMSSIGGTMQNLTVSNLGNNNKTVINSSSDVGDDIAHFVFKKNNEKDDLQRFKEVLENEIENNNNNNYLNIDVKSFFTQKCLETIYDQKLKGKLVAASLLSHMILTNTAKNKKKDNPNSLFWSLLGLNGKEEYFNKLQNTTFKTYDKNFTLDIFDTNDEEIKFSEKGKNNELASLIDQYFTYIHFKGIKGTFIPSLVGVFKIKINDFKTLLVFITRNSLVENVPKNFYTYWQLIRFLQKSKPQKMSSSQFNSGTLVKDDPIFERSFQIESRKDNPNYNKIGLKNYIEFEETIKSDIQFLNKCRAQNFDLLLMYYEYENAHKPEKQGTFKIKKTDKGTEIEEGSLPKGDIFEEFGSPITQSKIPESPGGGIFTMEENFFDDNDFGGKNFNQNKNIGNLFDVDEKINISGHDGVFDSFNCLCFFTFENIFDIRKRIRLSNNYYNNFQANILNNFTEYKSN